MLFSYNLYNLYNLVSLGPMRGILLLPKESSRVRLLLRHPLKRSTPSLHVQDVFVCSKFVDRDVMDRIGLETVEKPASLLLIQDNSGCVMLSNFRGPDPLSVDQSFRG
jgi:hypothetical protein